MTNLTMRPYRDDNDYWRLRELLRQGYRLTGAVDAFWPVARLDYAYWHVAANCFPDQFPAGIAHFWETLEGDLVAALTREGTSDAFLQVLPAYRSPELLGLMIAAAEHHFCTFPEDRVRFADFWVSQRDTELQAILRSRGYAKTQRPEHLHIRKLDGTPLPDVPLAPGYTIRSLGDVSELPARSWLSWRVFHPDAPDSDYEGWTWYHNIQRAPLYRRDLDLIAVAADGEMAAMCTLWLDDVTRTAMLEPVGTHPDHQRRGLGLAILTEGLRRAQRLGAQVVTVGGYSQAANALYDRAVSPDVVLLECWQRQD